MGKHNQLAFSEPFIRYDWSRAWAVGCDLALERSRYGDEITKESVMYALLCDAVSVAAIAYQGPPRTRMPMKSVWPDVTDDVTMWQKITAYLNGQLDELPEAESQPPRPSSEQITRADMVLELWHKTALVNQGDSKRLRKAVYLKCCGVKDRKVRAVTGYTRQKIHAAKQRAMSDMLYYVSAG